MAKSTTKKADDLRPEYNLRELLQGGVRGKYVKAYQGGTNLVALAPDVKEVFPDETAVNDALRLVIELRKVGEQGSLPKDGALNVGLLRRFPIPDPPPCPYQIDPQKQRNNRRDLR